jgi:hypothetical protein
LGCNYRRIAIVGEEKILLGAVVLMDESGQPRISPHVFTQYQGILFSSIYVEWPIHRRAKVGLDLVNQLLEACVIHHKRFIFCLHHNFEDLRALQWLNYHASESERVDIKLAYTGLIELRKHASFDAYLSTIRSVKRQEYRKASLLSISSEGPDGIDVLASLHRMTFERQGAQYDNEQEVLLRSIASSALNHSYGELLVCRMPSGEPIAATLFLRDSHTAYYLFGANHPSYRKTGASTFLVLENVRRAYDVGLRDVDLVGINSPARGDFKTSLNAKPVAYFLAAWNPSGSN